MVAFIYKRNFNKKNAPHLFNYYLNTYHSLIKVNHEKNIKHFNNSKFVYITASRHKVGKLSEKKPQV